MLGAVVRLHSATLSAVMGRDGVLSARISGVLTAEMMDRFAADCCERYGAHAHGFVVDYRSCVLAAKAADLLKALRLLPARSPMYVPGAFVCTPPTAPLLMQHAQASARAGARRRVFYDPAVARLWVLARSAAK